MEFKNKKIAICLSGEPRCIKYGSEFIKKYFNDVSSDIDFFCHAWSTISEKHHEYIKPTELNLLEDKILTNTNTLYEYINKIYKPKELVIEDTPSNRNYGQFFSAERVINLKKKYESRNKFKYDIVVRLRWDTAISDCVDSPYNVNLAGSRDHGNIDINKNNKLNFYNKKLNHLYIKNIRLHSKNNRMFPLVADQGPFIGSSEIMDSYHKDMSKYVVEYWTNFETKRGSMDSIEHLIYPSGPTTPEIVWGLLFCIRSIVPKVYPGICYCELIRYGCPDNILDPFYVKNFHRYRNYMWRSEIKQYLDYNPDIVYNDE